ncbi:MAG: 4Fe-4S binding protein [Candidatus Helarchaeota archaeon]|nr:4Fe-4S binding protein [Candidatus Helarchaeota archaeon]
MSEVGEAAPKVKAIRYVSEVLLYGALAFGIWGGFLFPLLLSEYAGTGLCPYGLFQDWLLGKWGFFSTIMTTLLFLELFWLISWILSAVLYSRAFCQYSCPLSLAVRPFTWPKRKITHRFSERWRDVALALLIVTLLGTLAMGVAGVSTFTGLGLYCDYCPFFVVYTDFSNPIGFVINNMPNSIIWFGSFLLLVVILSLLTGARTWCAYICPAGALLGLVGRKSIFGLYRDREKCIKCKKCEDVCTMQIMPRVIKEDLELVPKQTCIGCGLCIDACPAGALSFGTKKHRGIRTHNLVKYILFSITIFFVVGYLLVSLFA